MTITKSFHVNRAKLSRQLPKQTKPLMETHTHRQRLTLQEEAASTTWIIKMQLWGWPPRPCQLRLVAYDFPIQMRRYGPIRI